jgi:hypothetical protein
MKKSRIQARPLELYQQILEHDPDTRMEDMAEVVSEWGELISNRRNSLRDENKVANREVDNPEKSIPKN